MDQLSPGLITIVAIVIAIFITVTIIWGVKAHRQRIEAGREELIGKIAEVRASLDPKGTVFVEGELWAAIAEQGSLDPGEEVIITKVDGLKLWVTKK